MDQFLFDENPSPMLIFDMDSLQILKTNTAFSDQYKYSKDDIKEGLSLKKIRPKEDIPKLMEALAGISSEGVSDPRTDRIQPKDGDIFHVRVTSKQVSYEGKNARLVMFQDISEQRAAEKKAVQSSEDLRYHIANSPLATITLNPELKIIEWSPRAEEILGFLKEEVMGKNFLGFDIFEDTERERTRERIQYLANGERDKDKFETKILTKNGDRLYIKVNSSIRRDSAEEVQSILSFVEDVTAQKKSEIKYQRLFGDAHDSILILKDGRFVDCNKKAEALFKTTRENIIGKTPAHFSPERQPDGTASEIKAKKRMAAEQNGDKNLFEWQHMDTEGNLIDVEVSLNDVIFPDGEYLQAIVRDVTHKKKVEAELRKNEQLFRNLFLKSPAALVMVDAQDRVQLVNDSFERMFGYSLDEISGKDVNALIVPDDERANAPKMKNRSYIEEDFRLEGVRVTKVGKKKNVIVAGMPVYVDDEPVAGLGMYIDITERKQSEKRVKESLDEKKFLLKEIHHRVKNNLAVISGYVQLQSFESENENIEKTLHDTQLHIKSIAMVHELLYQSQNFSSISLSSYIGRLLDGITDIFPFDEDNIQVHAEADEAYVTLEKAIPCAMLINELVTNAYKHAFNGRSEGHIEVKIHKLGDRINIEVADDGNGLPEDFDQGANDSLGMNLIKTLTDQLEAELTFDSSRGAVFHFSFISDAKRRVRKVAEK